MRRITIRRAIVAAVTAFMAAFPIGGAWIATSPLGAVTAAHAATVKSQKYKGPAVNTRWGNIQAIITVKNKKITGVAISSSPDTARSSFIQSQALPTLRSETLQAQSANINEVSGATDVSAAYIQSLQSAIKSARAHKALK
jgi:uncharacterized protein with FMN-binding domain